MEKTTNGHNELTNSSSSSVTSNSNDSSEVTIKTEKMDEDAAHEEENDPIVKEIPVFLAKTLSQNLYLFQVCKRMSLSVELRH